MKNTSDIHVSIIVLTYNHAGYVRKALDSILMQKVNFTYEILIGDDCSLDESREILKEYRNKNPDIIRLFLRDKNIGATKNGYDLYQKAKGKYIAQLEGDDYWSDENKLQKQINFLRKNEEYIGCSHLCTVVDENGTSRPEKNQNKVDTYWYYSKSEFTFKDSENGKYPGHFSSLVYHNIFKNPKYDYSMMYKVHNIIFDRTLAIFLSMNGNLYRINELMSCYRLVEKNTESNWQSMARQKNRRYEEYHYLRQLEEYVQKEIGGKFVMINTRREKLVCATVVLLNEFNIENLKVVFSMVRNSGCCWRSFILVANTVIQKIYYRKICGMDRPVKF